MAGWKTSGSDNLCNKVKFFIVMSLSMANLFGLICADYGYLYVYNSNHDRGPNTHVIRLLERNGIPYHYLRTTKVNKREDQILDLVQNTDFLVLARYMQVSLMIVSYLFTF